MHEPATTGPNARAGRREWIGLAVLALPTLLIALDIGVLFLALPHLSGDLGASGTEQLWITDIYGFMLAGFLVTMGTLGDRVGRRKLLLIGAAAFGLASILAAYANTPEMLIAARAALGIAGATLGPSTLALISNMFLDARQRGVAISLWGFCQFGGSALGPVIGGVMLNHFWWGSVFLLGVPVMVLLLVVAPKLLPEYRDPNAGRLDLVSVGLSLLAILPVIYGIKELAAGHTDPVLPVGTLVVGVVFGVLFVRRQRHLTNPLIDLGLFARPAFRVILAAMTIGSATLAGISLLSSQWVQSVMELSPREAGLWQAPTGVGIAAGVLLAPVIIRLMKPATAMLTGLGVSTVALLGLTQVGAGGGLFVVVIAIAAVAFGVGPLFALGTGLVVSSAPVEKAGSAASLSETSNVFGSTLGLALLGTIGTAVYSNQLTDAMPDGVPADAADAAKETIGGAQAAAAQLPPEQANDLFDVAKDAFTNGMNVVAAVGVVLLVGVALVLRRTLRADADTAPDSAADQDATEVRAGD